MTQTRRASTVCVVREADEFEVLMVRRPLTARFMPGVWVFPGGAVDDEDSVAPASFGGNGPETEWKVAALRELIEETGIWVTTSGIVSAPLASDAFATVEDSEYILDQDALIYFSNWITPEPFPIRFDTRFFLTVVDSGTHAQVDGDELIDLEWLPPSEALRREEAEEWALPFPTRQSLLLLASEPTATALANRLQGLPNVPSIQPRMYVDGIEARIVLPGEEGFDALGPAQGDPTILQRLHKVVSEGGQVPAELRYRP